MAGRQYICGVPGCNNKGTFGVPNGPLREDWYRILQLSRKSNSHRICADHFHGRDIGISGKKLRANVIPTRNLPLNLVSLHTTNTVFPILSSYLNLSSLLIPFVSFSFFIFIYFLLYLKIYSFSRLFWPLSLKISKKCLILNQKFHFVTKWDLFWLFSNTVLVVHTVP